MGMVRRTSAGRLAEPLTQNSVLPQGLQLPGDHHRKPVHRRPLPRIHGLIDSAEFLQPREEQRLFALDPFAAVRHSYALVHE
jgi:hypothetical protein